MIYYPLTDECRVLCRVHATPPLHRDRPDELSRSGFLSFFFFLKCWKRREGFIVFMCLHLLHPHVVYEGLSLLVFSASSGFGTETHRVGSERSDFTWGRLHFMHGYKSVRVQTRRDARRVSYKTGATSLSGGRLGRGTELTLSAKPQRPVWILPPGSGK